MAARNSPRPRGQVQAGVSAIVTPVGQGIRGIGPRLLGGGDGRSTTRARYPLSTADLITTIQSSQASGQTWAGVVFPSLKALGYKNERQIATQLASAGWTQAQVEQAMDFKPGGLTQLWDSLKQGVLPPVSGPAGAGAEGGAAGGGAAAASGVAGKAALFGAVGASIGSPLDFLKFVAWIFHPRNILRAVEFLVGIVLMVFGFNAAMQARGEKIEGFTTSEGALTRSGLGRVATELGRAARGGQRPNRPASAPHRTRQRALSQRYSREERVRERERKGEKPTGHSAKTKGSGAGTRKAPRP